MCSSPGYGRFGGAVKRTRSRGLASHVSPNIGCRPRASFIRGRIDASPSITRGGSPVRESRTPGSVRGVFSNGHPYRDNPVKFVSNRSLVIEGRNANAVLMDQPLTSALVCVAAQAKASHMTWPGLSSGVVDYCLRLRVAARPARPRPRRARVPGSGTDPEVG